MNILFVSFDLPLFLVWLFISTLIPGALLSLSIFRKDDFGVIEKLFIGFALGVVILPLPSFLLYLVLNIKFSYTIALLSVGILYLISIAFFIKNRVYEDLQNIKFTMPQITGLDSIPRGVWISLALLLVLFVSYMVRLAPYSPIYQELDPYYYTDIAQQLLTFGENPINDQTAWYPMVVDHRQVPQMSYLEATWYSLYTGGVEYNNMLLALIASMYPPIVATLAMFFIYLFVSETSRKEWGIIAAGLASFVPMAVYKLSAGSFESQSYAFFALTFFYAMYALSLKRQDHKFSMLAGIGFAALALGSGSQIVALVSLMLFMVIQSIFYFLKDKDEKNLKYLLIMNGIIFVIGPLLGSSILRDYFESGTIGGLNITLPLFVAIAFVGVLYAIKMKVNNAKIQKAVLAAIIIAGLLVVTFTPLGDYMKSAGRTGFGIAEYQSPLERTIAEQAVAPASFGGQIGYIAENYDNAVSILLSPLGALIGSDSTAFISIKGFVTSVVSLIFLPFSFITNIILSIFVNIVNLFLGTEVDFSEKSHSLLLFWSFVFWVLIIFSAYNFFNKKDDSNHTYDPLFLFVLAVIMPPFIVGLIKAKYTIYAGVLFAIAIGYSFGAIEKVIENYLKISEERKKQAKKYLLAMAVVFVLLQFSYNGMNIGFLWGSFQPLYQNNPDALTVKFQQICIQTGDPEVCAAAADPLGYANLGTNYQYNQKLCALSILSKYSYISDSSKAPFWENHAVSIRCNRLTPYWIDAMEWINQNTESDARIISWWDYGHWTNFFGQRNTVLRNEHRSHEMIGEVAHGFLDASPEELKEYMLEHDSKYAMFDVEIVAGGGMFGGKYGALDYLSCAWDNQTDVSKAPTESVCEAEHLWETIFVTSNPCTISPLTGQTGLTAYKIYEDIYKYNAQGVLELVDTVYRPYYRPECYNPGPDVIGFCHNALKPVATYCVGDTTLANGEITTAAYKLNETYPNGDLKLNKGILQMPYGLSTTYHFGPVQAYTILYTESPLWIENGVVKSGYEDRTGRFYDSPLYRAMVLNNLPGFDLVYTTPDGAVKIFKITE